MSSGHQEAQGSGFGFSGLTTDLADSDLFRDEGQTAATRDTAPQDSGANFQNTIRELGQEEAARRFIADQHFSSGPGGPPTPFRLPVLPIAIPFLCGCTPMGYRIRSAPTPEEFTFPGYQDDEILQVPVSDLRQFYSIAHDYWAFLLYTTLNHTTRNPCAHDMTYRQLLRQEDSLRSRVFKRDVPLEQAYMVQAPVPRPLAPHRSTSLRRSLLGRTEDAGSVAKRDR